MRDLVDLTDNDLLHQAYKCLREVERRGRVPDSLIGHVRLAMRRAAFVGQNLDEERERETDKLRSYYEGLSYEDFRD